MAGTRTPSCLEYTEWRNFENVIDKAKIACGNSGNNGNNIAEHFVDVNKTIEMPKQQQKRSTIICYPRYACYLIVQNGDPRKEVIALGQTYFAVKTKQQELIEDYDELTEDQKRLAIRNEMIAHDKSLAEAASSPGCLTKKIMRYLELGKKSNTKGSSPLPMFSIKGVIICLTKWYIFTLLKKS